jgi:hypothetical protein
MLKNINTFVSSFQRHQQPMTAAAVKAIAQVAFKITKATALLGTKKAETREVGCIKRHIIICGISHNGILDTVVRYFTYDCVLFYAPNQAALKLRMLVEQERAMKQKALRALRKNKAATETRGRKENWPNQCKACRMRALDKPGVAC